MSGAAGPFTELLWAGPSVSYAAQAAASSSAQFLMPGASGAYEQPFIPVNWWQIGRRNQRGRIELAGVINSTSGTATTAIVTVGLATASNTATPGTGGGALIATAAATVTSFAANTGWRLDCDMVSRSVGYGTTSVSTSVLTDVTGNFGSVQAYGSPTLLSTIDCGAQWWVYATVTFSTAATTNSCQLTRADVWGLN